MLACPGVRAVPSEPNLPPSSEDRPMRITFRRLMRTPIIITVLLAAVCRLHAEEPPKGFVALFNGKDLTGWHGMPHFDPYKLEAMPEAERRTQIDKWTADAKKHWSVDKG